MSTTLGVGILGAGPVTQAIHLPTLARLGGQYRVVSVMDVDPSVATAVAGRVGARASTSQQDVLEDPDVEVVAICSPHQFHAAQVEAACAAGKRGILCEKPFAVSAAEAAEIAAVAGAAGVPLVVGAMHAYDPGWLAVHERCGDLLAQAHTIRSSIVLPFNDRFEDWATEIAGRPTPGQPPDLTDPQVRAAMVRGLVLGLTIHDLPLIRPFAPHIDRVDFADFLAPFGGAISLQAAGRSLDLLAVMRPQWRPEWTLDIISDAVSAHVEFTPSYVHAGSARAELTRDGHTEVFGPYPHNGYEGEWAELYGQVVDGAAPRYPLADLIDDLTYATDIAERSAASVLERAA